MSYLLDTDICSAIIKGERRVWARAMQYSGRPYISAITEAELFSWVFRAKRSPVRLQGLMEFLSDVTLLSVNQEVARKFGEIRASQFDRGRFTPEMDLLIASTALVNELTLVTHNTQDYDEVPGLVLEDWLTP